MSENPNELSYRKYPTTLILFGLFSIGGGFYLYLQKNSWLGPAIALALALLFFLLASVLEVNANRITRTLSISRRGLIQRYHQEIAYSEITSIHVGTSYDSGNSSRTYRVEIKHKDGNIVPLRKAYSSGKRSKEKQAQKLRDFIGIEGVDTSFGGMINTASRVSLSQLRAEQESITGDQNETHVTDGIRWTISTHAFNTSLISRWHSSDYTLPENFLYLTQKMKGQKNLPDNKLLQSVYDKLFEQSLKIYNFDKADTPNLSNADLFPLDTHLEGDFFAYTSDKALAQKILNPWVERPLGVWAHKHPFTQGSTDQLAVLFSPRGLYIAVMGYINQEYLDELARLGAELIRAQEN